MILNWEKPARKMPVEQWREISADGAPPGVYTPNMSAADAATWRAKKIGGTDPRVEIRVLKGSQVLIVVRPHEIRVSMNGPAQFSNQEFDDMHTAVREAMDVLGAGSVTRYVVATEDNVFATEMYSDDEPMVFTELEHARAEQEDRNAGFNGFHLGPGRTLIRAQPWRVYELVEVTLPCEAEARHGPGYQSRTKCELRGEHEVHRAIYMGQEATWRGPVAYTGVCDEPPVE